MRRTAVLLIAALAGAPALAAAAPEADEAQFRFLRGNQLYRQGRFEDALSEYYQSNRLVPNRNVEFNIARCLEKLRRFDEAFRVWTALEAGELPEQERALVRESVERLRPHVALLRVTSTPPGADIYLARHDLGSLGQTPKLMAVPEGKVSLILEKDGHRPREVAVELARGKEAAVEVALERIYGRVGLRGLPPTAVVRLGGAGGTILLRGSGEARLPPARHVLHVSAPGSEPVLLEVEVRPDATTTVPVSLKPLYAGSIIARTNVEGALLRVDGKDVGFLPMVVESVAVGTREIEVSKEGYAPLRTTVEVKEAEPTRLDVRLRQAEPQITGATKELVGAAEAPASITVITAEEIEAFGYLTLADALAAVRGAFVSDDRTYESVGFRGFSPPGDYTSRVLVLLDGHPTNEVLTGQGFVGRGFDVDLANVERIEVVRGPGSVLYGTGALFGVVNVVTRRGPSGTHAEASGRAGTLGLGSGRLTAGARGSGFELAGSGAASAQRGDRRFAWDESAGQPATVARGADQETAWHADLRGRAGPITLRAAVNQREKAVPTGAFETRAEPGTTYRDLRAFAELRAAGAWGRLGLSARAAYDESRFDGAYKLRPDPAGGPRPDLQDRFRARWLTGEARAEVALPGGHRLTAGGEVQSQFLVDLGAPSLAAQRAGQGERELVLSGYAADDWAPGPRLRLNLGLRADHHVHSFGTTVNPRLAIIVRPYARGNTKLLVGRAFRAPSAYERFYNDGGVTQLPAGPLTPETLLSAELEHTHALGDELALVVAGFAHQVGELMTLDTDPGGQLIYRNFAGKVRSLGVEGEVRWEPEPGSLVAAVLSWQRVRSERGGLSGPFPNAPEALASLRWIYPLAGGLRLGNEVLLDSGRPTRDGQRLDDALVWNVTLSGAYAAWRLRYFAGIYNVLDVRGARTGFPVGPEVPSLSVPRYGRSARVGLAFGM
jgi:outer membrane receptor protein involved in Fe transport